MAQQYTPAPHSPFALCRGVVVVRGAPIGGNDLRSKMQAAMILAVSVWGLAEAKVFQTLLWGSRTNR